MRADSFARWHIPREVDGLALYGDLEDGPGQSGLERRHHHVELEMHLVTQGQCVFLVGESRIHAERGTLLWVPPRLEHTALDPSPGFRRWMLLSRSRLVRRVLPPEGVRTLLAAGANADGGRLCRKLAPQQTHALVQKFEESARGSLEHFSLHNATMSYLLASAFSAFSASDALPAWSTLHPAVSEAVRLLRTEAEQPSRAELARCCGLSEWHLSKLFHQQVGLSLVDFRNRCRLERFLELYGGGRVKMTTAALDAGFGSYPQFHRVFRARMGHSPAEHARRRRLR